MSGTDIIGWASLLAFVVFFIALYRFIVSPGRRLDRLLQAGTALGLRKLAEDAPERRKLIGFLTDLVGRHGKDYRLGRVYWRSPDAFLVSMVTMRRSSRPGGSSTTHRTAYRFVSTRPTGLERGFPVNVKPPPGFAGGLATGVIERMGIGPAPEERLLPEFSERFWVFGPEPTAQAPPVPRGLQESFIRHSRDRWSDAGALGRLAAGSGATFAPQGLTTDFAGRGRIELEDLREILDLGDSIRRALGQEGRAV